MDTGAAEPLFASPQVVVQAADGSAGDGSVVLRSADALGAYPATVMLLYAQPTPADVIVAGRTA